MFAISITHFDRGWWVCPVFLGGCGMSLWPTDCSHKKEPTEGYGRQFMEPWKIWQPGRRGCQDDAKAFVIRISGVMSCSLAIDASKVPEIWVPGARVNRESFHPCQHSGDWLLLAWGSNLHCTNPGGCSSLMQDLNPGTMRSFAIGDFVHPVLLGVGLEHVSLVLRMVD